MKFKLKTNDYREFRGYCFMFGKPVEIRDRGTIEALTGHPDFEAVQDEVANGHDTADKVVGTLKLPRRPGRPKRDEAVL